MATIHVSPGHEGRCFILGRPTSHWYQISSTRMQVDSQRLKFQIAICFVIVACFASVSRSPKE
jgi:hypothetical protein